MTGLTFITKQLLDDCAIDLQKHARDFMLGKERSPIPRPEPVQPAVSPFPDAAVALQGLLMHGCETSDGDDTTCFYCGSTLSYEPHSKDCAYLRALETK